MRYLKNQVKLINNSDGISCSPNYRCPQTSIRIPSEICGDQKIGLSKYGLRVLWQAASLSKSKIKLNYSVPHLIQYGVGAKKKITSSQPKSLLIRIMHIKHEASAHAHLIPSYLVGVSFNLSAYYIVLARKFNYQYLVKYCRY